MGSSVKKIYSPKFKVKVIKYAQTQNNVAEASRQFEVNANTIRRWISEYENSGESEEVQ